MSWLDVIGWFGSALLVYSVMQARVLRFRVLNLGACVVLGGFNAALGIWPMVAMNAALCVINVWHVRHLVGTRHDAETYSVLEVGANDAYLVYVLQLHAADIRRFQPDFDASRDVREREAFVIQRGDETVGVVLLRVTGTVAHISLDYVTPRYRDFSPGEFVWRHAEFLDGHGISTIVSSPATVDPYYGKVGFTRREDGAYELRL